ncbi:hypothetical protein RRG08_007015 [Elysia crispata]|uniref:Uncharacterized protein n=1 Tax=Elysia crispata TaxID=231223 RepID=A0AAE0ZIS7_9GAST|nr:hypothetical protein RRG08_007015 [Elysia crispata]
MSVPVSMTGLCLLISTIGLLSGSHAWLDALCCGHWTLSSSGPRGSTDCPSLHGWPPFGQSAAGRSSDPRLRCLVLWTTGQVLTSPVVILRNLPGAGPRFYVLWDVTRAGVELETR